MQLATPKFNNLQFPDLRSRKNCEDRFKATQLRIDSSHQPVPGTRTMHAKEFRVIILGDNFTTLLILPRSLISLPFKSFRCFRLHLMSLCSSFLVPRTSVREHIVNKLSTSLVTHIMAIWLLLCAFVALASGAPNQNAPP